VRPVQLSYLDDYKLIEEIGLTAHFTETLPSLLTEQGSSIFADSPFEEIISRSAKSRGKLAEDYIDTLSIQNGFQVEHSPNNDRIINGIDTEIKFCRESEANTFVLNQIRDNDYKFLLALVVRPWNVYLYTIPKRVILARSTPQHKSQNGSGGIFIYNGRTYDMLRNHFDEYEGLKKFRYTFKRS
jgi:hypothetical protein